MKAEKPEALPQLPLSLSEPKFFDKPKEPKKFGESRRERRASMRSQAAKERGVEFAEGAEEMRPVTKKEHPQEGGRTGRDRKHNDSEHRKDTEERRSSLESNGGGESRPETTGTRAERDVARIRKKVTVIKRRNQLLNILILI